MAEFIKDYSIIARKRKISGVEGAMIYHPAYILVFLIHVLAWNTDFPFEVCQDAKMYTDLCSPLFFVLQALVDVSMVDGDQDLVNDAYLHLYSIFRAITKAEDAVDVQMTSKLHVLAEIGIFTLNALNHGGISVLQTPGQVLLPSSLYRASLIKNGANSKCPKSHFDDHFLMGVFETLKKLIPPQPCTHKNQTAKTLPKHGHKGLPNSKINVYGVLDLAPNKLDNLSSREIANAKIVRPNIPPGKRRKCVALSGSGSVGLHECSTIEKQQKFASKHFEKTIERNISSSDSVSCKDSLSASHVPTRKSKRTAACLLENAMTSSKQTDTVQPFKCPRTKLRDTTCGSKKQDVLADVSNKNHSSPW
ncbi:hypothetical protein RJT34_12222 [Clitoria ternatea]|uniref:Uncharacterized protein n=1 Tax=Clitoria ternatea TaxID=43366 RepID=A0AAN9JPY4_CLITE